MLKHLLRSPFVSATGAAAFVHSTWALAVIFGGLHPEIASPADFARWLAWVAPAAMIAFALDVGQINTSVQIARLHAQRRRPLAKYFTFLVFAVATYYLQWYHLIHHMPALDFSPGIQVTPLIAALRTAAIWIIPALLPLSTLLYTFSHTEDKEVEQPTINFSAAPSRSRALVVQDSAPVIVPASSAASDSEEKEATPATARKRVKRQRGVSANGQSPANAV